LTVNAADKIVLQSSDRNFTDRVSLFDTNIVGNNEGSANGLFANTRKDFTDAAGHLNVRTGQLIVQDGAKVTVSADGSAAAENFRSVADSMRLKNGTITATTQAGKLGNITLQTRELQIRQQLCFTA